MTTVFDHSHGSVVDRHIGREENKQPTPWTPSLHAALDPGTTETDLLLDQLLLTTATISLLLLPRRSAPLIQRDFRKTESAVTKEEKCGAGDHPSRPPKRRK
jgi:hypothetical protein